MPVGQNSLFVLSTEQKKVRSILVRLQQCLNNVFWKNPEGVDLDCLRKMFRKFILLDQYCRARSLEKVVIPAIRKATTEADSLLSQLDAISAHSVHMLWYVYDQIDSAMKHGMVSVKALFSALEVYCKNLQTRLIKEECELLPMARRVLSNEEWFAIGKKCYVARDKKSRKISKDATFSRHIAFHKEPLISTKKVARVIPSNFSSANHWGMLNNVGTAGASMMRAAL